MEQRLGSNRESLDCWAQDLRTRRQLKASDQLNNRAAGALWKVRRRRLRRGGRAQELEAGSLLETPACERVHLRKGERKKGKLEGSDVAGPVDGFHGGNKEEDGPNKSPEL